MIFLKNRCYNGGNKHKFESRYTEQGAIVKIGELVDVTASQLRTLLVHNIYVKDVCVWCGKVINDK